MERDATLVSAAVENHRIRTICVSDPTAQPEVIESGVKDLVFALHGRWSIRCLASCHGHGQTRWLHRDPYLYFHSDPSIAEWAHLIVLALGDRNTLSRRWHVTGVMHPKFGLCFRLFPMETGPLLDNTRQDRLDLALLAKILPKAMEVVTQIPLNVKTDYYHKQRHAERIVLDLVANNDVAAGSK